MPDDHTLLGAAARVVNGLASALVCAVLAYHGARFVALEQEAGGVAVAGVPAWIFQLVVPFGFGVMSLRFLISCAAPAPPVGGGAR